MPQLVLAEPFSDIKSNWLQESRVPKYGKSKGSIVFNIYTVLVSTISTLKDNIVMVIRANRWICSPLS